MDVVVLRDAVLVAGLLSSETIVGVAADLEGAEPVVGRSQRICMRDSVAAVLS